MAVKELDSYTADSDLGPRAGGLLSWSLSLSGDRL